MTASPEVQTARAEGAALLLGGTEPPEMTGDELRAYRQALGLTAKQLGTALGASENTVLRWEQGHVSIGRGRQLRLALVGLREVLSGRAELTEPLVDRTS